MAEEPQHQQLIDELKQMILTEKNLNARMDDEYLQKYLTTCEFDCKKSFKTLQNYYKLRKKASINNYNPKSPNIKRIWEDGILTILSKPDSNGRKIFICCIEKWNPDYFNINEAFAAFFMCLEVSIKDEIAWKRNEFILVVNAENIGLNQAKHITPTNVINFLRLFEDSFPVYFHQLHIIHVNRIFKIIYKLCSPLLSKNLREKLFLHGNDLQLFHQHVEAHLLPLNFEESMQLTMDEELMGKLIESDDYLRELNSFGYVT